MIIARWRYLRTSLTGDAAGVYDVTCEMVSPVTIERHQEIKMLSVHLYDMAKVREQDFLAEAARHPHLRRDGEVRLFAGVARLLRRRGGPRPG